MRRLPRLPIDRALSSAAAPRRPLALQPQCLACCASSFSTTPATRAAAAGNAKTTPWTEKMRRKIWGTDRAPGREDPYSPDSPMRAPQRPDAQQKKKAAAAATAATAAARGEADGAAAATEVVVDDAEYEPAKTWDSLEWVGGEGREHLLDDDVSIPRKQKVLRPKKLADALRKVLIQEAKAHTPSDGKQVLLRASAADHGPVLVEKEKSPFRQQPAKQAKNKGVAKEGPGSANAKARVRAWKHISLRDPAFKFAVVQRFMKKTGIFLPDVTFAGCDKAETLLDKFTELQRQKTKASQHLATKLVHKKLHSLPNVKISHRRVTPIDKEKALGRWKVIEQKLIDNYLPVTGSRPQI